MTHQMDGRALAMRLDKLEERVELIIKLVTPVKTYDSTPVNKYYLHPLTEFKKGVPYEAKLPR